MAEDIPSTPHPLDPAEGQRDAEDDREQQQRGVEPSGDSRESESADREHADQE